jgi:DNA-binding IclR family transcriptional regulator
MRASPPVKSACRVFEVLEHFKEQQDPLRLSEIADRMNYPLSSTSALLKTMLHSGYLQFDPKSKRYFPSPRLAQLVSWIGKYNPERGPLLESMRRLQKRTVGFVVLAQPVDLYVEFIETMRSSRSDCVYVPPGVRRLIVQNGIGWLFLSRMPERAVAQIYRRTIAARLFAEREFPFKALLKRIEPLRDQNHAIAHAREYIRPPAHWSYAMISMMVPPGLQRDPMAIGICAPATRIERDRDDIIGELAREMARLARLADPAGRI